MAQQKKYKVQVRVESSDADKARMIIGFNFSCRPSILHDKIAVLEAHLLLDDPGNNYKAVHVDENGKLTYIEERAVLPEEDRRKVNEKIPAILSKGSGRLKRLFTRNFQYDGSTRYIG
ncbi:MAG: hypothetical protein KJ718_05235 [Nanoarchaeota archaeon]|nr:hypothetical protein [Nanoarchaeota archaeon]MBU1051929.1 hypothetical protein [Nanoarchaeota archaeon]MBU1988327.1 hypothetical protein [Nanoarchaeota archaeon]